ncbi:MAG TPA: hypothetical protein VL172_14135 [Kofleriaceae bacterium]|jgi:hypothetical protein|nr:hypothetical protein [Kofleriaceae bacterium]
MKGFTGERKAISAAVFAFYAFFYLLAMLIVPPEWSRAIAALAGIYGLAFFSLVAGYFWARWFSIGVGIFGALQGAIGLWQLGTEPVIVFMFATHLAASLLLWGSGMASGFDGRTEWRTRFHLDEGATNRLGKSIIRAGVSLPMIVLYALAPKEGAGSLLLGLAALALAGAGTWALLRLRTWGVLALAGAAGALAASLSGAPSAAALDSTGMRIDLLALGTIGTVALIAAIAPFLAPIGRYVRSAR